MIAASLLLLALQAETPFGTLVNAEARGLYCSALLRDDRERRRAVRPFLASTDPAAVAETDAAMAEDRAALARFATAPPGRPPLDASTRQVVAARAAEDVSTLQSLQNAEEGCEATACMTRARAARDADPTWARLADCRAGPRP